MGITPTLPFALRRLARAGRRSRRGLPRPRHDRCRRMVPGAPPPVRVRAGRHVQAAAAQGPPQAGIRLDADPRRRLGREARHRLVVAGAGRPRRSGGRPVDASGSAGTPSRSRRRRATATRSRTSSPRALRSSSTSAASRRRRESSTSSRPRERCRTSTSSSPARTTGTARWGSSRRRSSIHSRPAGSTCCRPPPGRPSTSTGAPMSSSSPRAARTSGSSRPRPLRSGRP